MLTVSSVIVYHPDGETRRWIADAVHSGHGKFKVIADTASMTETLVLARFHTPNILLLGANESPDMREFLFSLRAATPKSRIIGYVDGDEMLEPVVPGYDALITRKTRPQKLLESLDKAYRDGV